MDAEFLRRGVQPFGLELTEAHLHACEVLLHELNEWNQRVNLTAIRDPQQQVLKHLLDSFSIQPYLRGKFIADVGTGAGFPGLPLALVNPERQFTLIDSINKKLRFVHHAAQTMKLSNVQVVHVRAELYKPQHKFDCIVSRALSSLENFVRWSGHLCAPGGRLLAMKGRYPEDELKSVPAGWQIVAVHAIQIDGLDEQRHLVELSAVVKTGKK
ncbi:MAG TPA: 16S rRNA (guanine(527)-N(7))-methyltransferase RsmG [Steroidobacteraceae bacterium]|nr:16S rRNA (guanine(527)-N(7))-methyltransferase RsmG [Steroidobacteraceae bacterium]